MSKDHVRQVTVAVGAAVAIAGAAWGSGAFGGTPIAQAADGALASDATLLAPATPAFAIWSAIYGLLAVFAVVQALPSRAADPRYRAVAWWILASMLLNAAWIAVVQAGWIVASVAVLLGIVAILAVVSSRLDAMERPGFVDALATEASAGLYLGWAAVASAANIAAAVNGVSTAWAVLLIAVVAVAALASIWRLRHRTLAAAVALAVAWGSAWIGVARLDEPANTVVALAAFVAAAAVALTGSLRLKPTPASAPA